MREESKISSRITYQHGIGFVEIDASKGEVAVEEADAWFILVGIMDVRILLIEPNEHNGVKHVLFPVWQIACCHGKNDRLVIQQMSVEAIQIAVLLSNANT